jgi:hypothetical protein
VRVLLCTLVAALSSSTAHAFLCTRAGADGPSLAWGPRTVEIRRSGESPDAIAADIERIVLASMVPWNLLDCSDMGLILGPPADDPLAGFDWAAGSGEPGNENVLVFRNNDPNDPVDAWLHQLGALAITTVTFESNLGRLLDADVEVNDSSFSFSICDPEALACNVTFDLQNTLTHELGHVLGLDHSVDSEATMFASAPRGDTSKRTLAVDDADALCTVYPSGAPAGECFGVAREDPPDVRFTPTSCRAGDATPAAAALVALWLARPRTRRRSW